MEILVLILLSAGLLCFVGAAFMRVQPARPALMPLGLAFWITTVIIGAATGLHG